jgi:hypothetical protein
MCDRFVSSLKNREAKLFFINPGEENLLKPFEKKNVIFPIQKKS